MDHSQFYLINLSPDPSMNEMLVYYLRSEETKVLGCIFFIIPQG